jgi:hypothetical protein
MIANKIARGTLTSQYGHAREGMSARTHRVARAECHPLLPSDDQHCGDCRFEDHSRTDDRGTYINKVAQLPGSSMRGRRSVPQ